MNPAQITIHGETWITLQTVADCYQVELSWVRTIFEHGLLGPGERVGDTIAVTAAMLERFATIRRLALQLGLDVEHLAWAIDWLEE